MTVNHWCLVGDHQKTTSYLMILTMMWQAMLQRQIYDCNPTISCSSLLWFFVWIKDQSGELGCLHHFRWMGIREGSCPCHCNSCWLVLQGAQAEGDGLWGRGCKPLEHYTHLMKLVAGKWKEAAGATTYILEETHGCPYPLQAYSGVVTGRIWWQGMQFIGSWTFPIDRKIHE